ncbi:hypothetical protein FRC17_002504 [Serendipita sp. 399]|nr:hypothetical protein FRC17_002504 [Serendipita sp. 399]
MYKAKGPLQETSNISRDSPPNLPTSPPRSFSRATSASKASGIKQPQISFNISPNGGGVFMVPQMSTSNSELRPPTPGWKRRFPIDPWEPSSATTAIGHENTGLGTQVGEVYSSPSPPKADLAVRKSVSEIGHGSISYAQISPDASSSSFEHHFPYNLNSPDPSQDYFPRVSVDVGGAAEEEERPPVPPKGRFSGLKRAFSFSRRSENKSTSDLPSAPTLGQISRHRPAKSADMSTPALGSLVSDGKARARLRRRSTTTDASRNASSPVLRLHNPPKFMLSPDASHSSILSNSTPALPSPASGKSVTPPPHTRRRLTKRKPSEKTKSTLPTTLEVETPKSGDIPNPMDALPPFQLLSPPPRTYSLPTPETPGLPLSAPPTTALDRPVPPLPENATALPPVPLVPSPLHPPIRRSSLKLDALPNPEAIDRAPFPKLHLAPPSAMRAIRPHLPHRPSLERRASRRRWTLDIASEEIDEEVLKQELERLRLLGQPSQGLNLPEESWTHARKVLLSSREVILTERSYLTQLTRFLGDASNDSNVPPLLMQHLPHLISASQSFVSRLTEDPSAWGVSAAFVTVEPILEQVFVDYCRVVGQIMLACQLQASGSKSASQPSSRSSMSKSRSSIVNGATSEFGKIFSSSNKSAEKVGEENKSAGLHQGETGREGGRGVVSVFPRSRSMPGKKANHRASLPANAAGYPPSSFGAMGAEVLSGASSGEKRSSNGVTNGKMKASTAADIAISPPQRVTRYVLLYRDILEGTPLTAASRPLVQRALDGAMRIAESCDKAQGNLTLIRPKP